MEKKALILVGGGTRGVIHGGACLAFEQLGLQFDLTVCVSVGICTGLFSNTGQVHAAHPVWTQYIPGDRFISWKRTRPRMDVLYLLRCLRDIGKLERDKIGARGQIFCVLTNLVTGAPQYVPLTSDSDIWRIIHASIAIPPFVHPIQLGDMLAADGGLSDPLPVRFALEQGCTDITVVMTRPWWRKESVLIEQIMAYLFLKGQPKARSLLPLAAQRYNRVLRLLKSPPTGTTMRVIYAPTFPWLHFLSTDPKGLQAWFIHGFKKAYQIQGRAAPPLVL